MFELICSLALFSWFLFLTIQAIGSISDCQSCVLSRIELFHTVYSESEVAKPQLVRPVFIAWSGHSWFSSITRVNLQEFRSKHRAQGFQLVTLSA
jgi:hypothetical protein